MSKVMVRYQTRGAQFMIRVSGAKGQEVMHELIASLPYGGIVGAAHIELDTRGDWMRTEAFESVIRAEGYRLGFNSVRVDSYLATGDVRI